MVLLQPTVSNNLTISQWKQSNIRQEGGLRWKSTTPTFTRTSWRADAEYIESEKKVVLYVAIIVKGASNNQKLIPKTFVNTMYPVVNANIFQSDIPNQPVDTTWMCCALCTVQGDIKGDSNQKENDTRDCIKYGES